MTTDLVVKETAAIARPLKVLVPLIKDDLQDAQNAGLEYYRKAGEKLQEARFEVKREGKSWGGWLIDNFTMSQETARTYMGYASEMEFRSIEDEISRNQRHADSSPARNEQRREIKTLSDFREPGRGSHQPEWQAPVQSVVSKLDIPKLRREYEDKLKENKVCRDLAIQLVDIGYKVLATKLHPDKGGSQEAMSRLTRIRLQLKQCAEDTWSRK